MSTINYVITGVVVSVTALVGYMLSKTQAPANSARRVGAKLAPGPKQNIFIGNLANFPQEKWYINFSEWQKQFGDLVFINLNVAGVTMLVVNSFEIAEELAGRRTKIYSDRPYTTMTCDLVYTGWSLVGLSVGPDFLEHRKIARKAIGPIGSPQYDTLIQDRIAVFLEKLPTTSGDPFNVLTPSVGEVVVRICYGYDFYVNHGNALAKMSLEAMELLMSVMTKFWVVDLFPFLRYIPTWFPGAGFRRIGAYATHIGKQIRFEPFSFVEKRMAEGKADHSIVSRFLQDPTLSKENIRDTTISLVAAGVDSTATAIMHFLYAIAMNPECQRRLQEELDGSIGNGRSPSFAEIENLPYFNAVFKESLRWTPPVPLGVPHVATEPDVYQGYYIPEGCILHLNIGFMTRDKRIWGDDSEIFNPDRFLSPPKPGAPACPNPVSMVFGFGRRICAGRFLGLRMAMQYAAAIISAYEIVPCETDDGKTLTPETTAFHEETIRAHLDLATSEPDVNQLYIGFASGYSGVAVTPQDLAEGNGTTVPGMNTRTIDYLANKRGSRFGVVLYDFIGSDTRIVPATLSQQVDVTALPSAASGAATSTTTSVRLNAASPSFSLPGKAIVVTLTFTSLLGVAFF